MPGFTAAFTFCVTSSICFEHVQFKVGALGFFRSRLGVEAGLHVVLAAGGKLMDAGGADVMVGEGEPVRRDEGARAAVIEAHRGKLRVLQPGLGEFESVLGLDLRRGREIKQPHAFVRRRYSGEAKDEEYDRHPTSHGVSCDFATLSGKQVPRCARDDRFRCLPQPTRQQDTPVPPSDAAPDIRTPRTCGWNSCRRPEKRRLGSPK